MARPIDVDMDPAAAHEVLVGVGQVRERARGDRRGTSVPLLVFGFLTLASAVLTAVLGPVGNLVLLLVAPAGFALIALYYRRREVRVGIGGGTRSYGWTALVLLLALVVLIPVVLLLGLYAVAGLGLLVIAVRQRNLFLGVCALLYGVAGGLESIGFFSIRLFSLMHELGLYRASDGYFSWSSTLVYVVLGSLMIGAGLYAHRREVAAGVSSSDGTEDFGSAPVHPTTMLTEVVHQRTRLGILSVLAECGRADFTYLKSVLVLTDGNLGRHLEILAEEGLVSLTKGYEGRRPRTWAEITKSGQRALAAQMAAMKELVAQFETRQAPAPERPEPSLPRPGHVRRLGPRLSGA